MITNRQLVYASVSAAEKWGKLGASRCWLCSTLVVVEGFMQTEDLQILNAAGASYHSPSPRRREDFMQTK